MRNWSYLAALSVAAFSSGLLGCEPDRVTPAMGEAISSAVPSAANPTTSPKSRASSTVQHARAVPTGKASSGPKSTKAARYEKLTSEEVAKLVKPQLAEEELAHPPFRGPFGPSQRSIVVITKQKSGDFAGFVLVERGGEAKRLDLPVLQESWPGESVEAVGFVPECDGDAPDELVVISKHRSAAGTATATTVIDYDGERFAHLQEVETLAAKAKSVTDVHTILETRTFVLRIDGVPVRILPTLRPKVVRARLEKLMGVKASTHTDQLEYVQLDYAEKKDREPARFAFGFNDRKVLQQISIGATSEVGDAAARNPTGAQLVVWLRSKAGEGEVDGTTTTWKHAGWVFVLDAGKTGEGDHHRVEIRPER